ncbi:hypothetical protein [Leptospira yasudae]|uniref:Lipoprotein n=1 Tax=Leptospira yasudae TaxID=2202201 RepID=A0ABX9M367_9LEPT|nr:hypothetical protein [Leptospira yasudae]RHX80046.1 hypothetical protein DLM77_09245 [Leptospira yasudae]
MKKVFYILFKIAVSILFCNCIDLPKPNEIKFAFYFSSLYMYQSGCSFYLQDIQDQSLLYKGCANYLFNDCSFPKMNESNRQRLKTLRSGLLKIASEVNNCVIEVYEEIQILDSMPADADPYLFKANRILKTDPMYFDTNCNSFTNHEKLLLANELPDIYDPSIYLAIQTTDNQCRQSIPLTQSERDFVLAVATNKKIYYLEH